LSFVCLVQIQLHFPDSGSLKGKRKELQGLKVQLQRRFGAAVAETDHHDLWQRATLSAAVVSRSAGGAAESAARIERYVRACFPDGVSTERAVVSADDLLGG
jgi:uncharacterized protein YlxP (DUF503 family)